MVQVSLANMKNRIIIFYAGEEMNEIGQMLNKFTYVSI